MGTDDPRPGANAHGLSRDIPDPVKREVRQRCGFGCVVCGLTLVQYEHVDPPFKDARAHDPAAIALLCPTHHGYVTTGAWSKERVLEALADPYCRRVGHSFGELDPSRTPPAVVFGGVIMVQVSIPLLVEDVPMIAIAGPEASGGPYRLSANFYDGQGRPSLAIDQNQWHVYSDQWDAELVGGVLTVRQRAREIALQVRFLPREGIIVERVNMKVLGYTIRGNAQHAEYRTPLGGGGVLGMNFMQNCRVGARLTPGGVSLG